jgi:hypothetical protein
MSVVPANLAAELHQGPPTENVSVALYGGPQDGLLIPVVPSFCLRGGCYAFGFAGAYELSGFYRAGNFDYAIYEWKGVKK